MSGVAPVGVTTKVLLLCQKCCGALYGVLRYGVPLRLRRCGGAWGHCMGQSVGYADVRKFCGRRATGRERRGRTSVIPSLS